MIENIMDEPTPSKGTEKPSGKMKPLEAQPLIIRAMEKIDTDDEWVTMGQLGQYLTAEHPDFDTRSYGKRKLSDLIDDLKLFESKRGPGNQLMVRRLD